MTTSTQTIQQTTPFLFKSNQKVIPFLKRQLIVPHKQGYDIIKWEDIIYLKALSNYTQIYCKNNLTYCYCKVLKNVSSKITSKAFLRCHQSFFINTQYLEKINSKLNNLELIMSNDHRIPVSRSCKAKLKSWIRENI